MVSASAQIKKDGDGRLSGRELYNALHHPELGIRELAARLVVRHDSEWYGGSWHQRWATYLLDYDRLRIKYARQWLDDCEWMSQVEPFSKGEPVWHMHPVVFLDALSQRLKITRDMLRKIWTDSVRVSDSLLESVAEELTLSLELCKINTINRLYHFMAQVYQEVGPLFNLNENFNYRPNVLKSKFAYYRKHAAEADEDGYIPGRQSARSENIANKAYADRTKNGGYGSGDGWKYRGRGMKQLTFRGNYRSFTIYHAEKWGQMVDFENEPDLLLENRYAVRSALYFWDFNKLSTRADQGISREISYSITEVVNKFDDHYEDRFNNLSNFLQKRIFDEIF